jgi:hypothetical protein
VHVATIICAAALNAAQIHRIGSQHFDAERITATDIMMNISIQQHAGTSHGKGVRSAKEWGL